MSINLNSLPNIFVAQRPGQPPSVNISIPTGKVKAAGYDSYYPSYPSYPVFGYPQQSGTSRMGYGFQELWAGVTNLLSGAWDIVAGLFGALGNGINSLTQPSYNPYPGYYR